MKLPTVILLARRFKRTLVSTKGKLSLFASKFLRAKIFKAKNYKLTLIAVDTALSSIAERFRRSLSLTAKKYKRDFVFVGIILTFLIITTAFYISRALKTKTYYIAYVGRYQRVPFDRLHELALRKYIDELNEDLSGVRLEMQIFDNKGGPEGSRQVYEKIAADKKIIAVIDNTWGRDFQSVAALIRENKIPVISINADKQTENLEGNVVFIGHDNDIPKSILAFSKKVLHDTHVIFITEDSFSTNYDFHEEFKNLETEVTRFSVSSSEVKTGEREQLFKNLDLELEKWHQKQNKPTVIINTHFDWGGAIIKYLDEKPFGITILGGPNIISRSEYNQFGQNKNGNRLIMLTNPSDTVSNKIYHDLKEIAGSEPEVTKSANAQLFVKRCLDAVSVIRGVFSEDAKENLRTTVSQSDVIKFFREKLIAHNYAGKYDLYSFDGNLLMSDYKTFEEHYQGEVSSYPKQLNSQREVIPNVYFGIEVTNISNIDIKNRTFHADFLFWLKYDKNFPDVEKYINFRNEKKQDVGLEIAISETNESTVYKLYKKSADFSIDADFKKFPFDVQELKIELALIVPSNLSLISFDHEGFKNSKKKAEEFSLNDWYMGDYFVTVDNFIPTLSRGRAGHANGKLPKFKTLTVRIIIHRRLTGPFVTIILPLIMIGVAAITILLIRDNTFGQIGDLSGAIFLSIVTYSIGFADAIPRTNILTTADMLFYLTFFTVLLIYLKVILFNSNIISDNLRTRVSNNGTRIGFIALTVYCLIATGIIIAGLI